MAGNNRVDGDLYVTGTLQPVALAAPSLCIGDAQMNPSSPIQVNKSQHQYKRTYGQPYGAIANTERRVIHIAQAVGTVYNIRAGLVLPCLGAATVTVDLKKNGTTVLSSVLTLDVSEVAYAPITGAIATSAYAANDVYEIFITATAGGGTLGQGLYIDVTFRELPG